MDWSDYFTENFGAPSSNHYNQENKNLSRDKIFNSIVELWLECAAFEVTLRQFKVRNFQFILFNLYDFH